jgi:hypothetical protein
MSDEEVERVVDAVASARAWAVAAPSARARST